MQFYLESFQLNGDQNAATRPSHNVGRYKYDRERKLGHRRVGDGGEITYKKIQSSHIMGSIQLGIQHTVRIKIIYKHTDTHIYFIFFLYFVLRSSVLTASLLQQFFFLFRWVV